jgi:hypothetical protein
MGAGLDASPGDGQGIVDKLKGLLGSEKYASEAQQFAARHRWFDSKRQVEQMLDRTCGLLKR